MLDDAWNGIAWGLEHIGERTLCCVAATSVLVDYYLYFADQSVLEVCTEWATMFWPKENNPNEWILWIFTLWTSFPDDLFGSLQWFFLCLKHTHTISDIQPGHASNTGSCNTTVGPLSNVFLRRLQENLKENNVYRLWQNKCCTCDIRRNSMENNYLTGKKYFYTWLVQYFYTTSKRRLRKLLSQIEGIHSHCLIFFGPKQHLTNVCLSLSDTYF